MGSEAVSRNRSSPQQEAGDAFSQDCRIGPPGQESRDVSPWLSNSLAANTAAAELLHSCPAL